jgi:hypothetical protein
MDWGQPPKDPRNPGPNEWNTVHSIAISADRRLFVIDRGHARINTRFYVRRAVLQFAPSGCDVVEIADADDAPAGGHSAEKNALDELRSVHEPDRDIAVTVAPEDVAFAAMTTVAAPRRGGWYAPLAGCGKSVFWGRIC